jgi:hypothetical protein
MIVSLSYSAKMVAMRTVETPQLPINSLSDVLDHSDWDFGFIGKALERGIFEVGRSHFHKKIFISLLQQFADPNTLLGRLWKKKIVPKKDKSLVADNKEGLRKAFASKYVFMCIHHQCRKVLQDDFGPEKSCQMQVLPEDYFLGALSIGFKRNSSIREFVNYRCMFAHLFKTLQYVSK